MMEKYGYTFTPGELEKTADEVQGLKEPKKTEPATKSEDDSKEPKE